MSRTTVYDSTSSDAWADLVDRMPHRDIAHFPNFLRVYEEYGDGIAECFVYSGEEGTVAYPYIKRPLVRIEELRDSGKEHFDITTPYCYGGYISSPTGEPGRLLRAFRKHFEEHAQRNNIVSEFIRFHPLLQNHTGSESLVDVVIHADNVVIDTTRSDDGILKQCRATWRRYIRRARRARVDVSLDDHKRYMADFVVLYRDSMKRHAQTGYLDFSPDYFDCLARNVPLNALLFVATVEQRLIAGALFLLSDTYLDYFLGASSPTDLSRFPNHLLMYESAVWAHRAGLEALHLGGGEESLMFFKSGFSDARVSYAIGRKIHDQSAYERLTYARFGSGEPPAAASSYFPVYRWGLE